MKTLRACLDFMKARTPSCGILENVPGFGHAPAGHRSALEIVLEEVRELGYAASAVSLCNSDHISCARKRTGGDNRLNRAVFLVFKYDIPAFSHPSALLHSIQTRGPLQVINVHGSVYRFWLRSHKRRCGYAHTPPPGTEVVYGLP